VAVEGLERGLQAGGKFEGIELATLAAAFLGHVLADVLPEVAIDRHFIAGDVFRDGNARQFDDAAFDGVHEREVAHRPREEGAFGVAGAAQEEWGGGEVEDAGQAELAVHRFEAGNPEAGGFVVLSPPLSLVTGFEVFVFVRGGLFAVAVVGLVVDDTRMFFMPMRSGMTRWIIWPSVSVVLEFVAGAAFEQRAADRQRVRCARAA
jgi:hypothetical protein